MKILTAEQIRALDKFTVENEPIASIELMERAAQSCTDWIAANIKNKAFLVLAGTGNNGGDGLAIARQLGELEKEVAVYVHGDYKKGSADFRTNFERLKLHPTIAVKKLTEDSDLPFEDFPVVIDALFGTGLNKPLEGFILDFIDQVNKKSELIVSIDVPSGVLIDLTSIPERAIQAHHTLTFQVPKLPFLFEPFQGFVGKIHILDIGLDQKFHEEAQSQNHFVTRKEAKNILHPRKQFQHKNQLGHVFLISGSLGKIGASILCSKAALRAGAGLLTAHVPTCGLIPFHSSIPEAMVQLNDGEDHLQGEITSEEHNVVIVGPGMGNLPKTRDSIDHFLRNSKQSLVLDADALNLLSENPEWWKLIAGRAILTPHVGEFNRLFSSGKNHIDQYQTLRKKAIETNTWIVLKGAYTRVASPKGDVFFNSTGNPGMATAGSGDVLAGMIGGLIAQGYDHLESCILGVYLHGLSGDLWAGSFNESSLMASDLIKALPMAYRQLEDL